ncbi:PaaI family thioesterase [Vibrio penaeicida]|uniref:Thioesterase n=1 Tax=Vibrio penaeicida TaxID=104609 RepID=A0AAV5NNK4_9VIBR|nr:PaaI family thioesterase [Vibrio penaeicida]RTZ19070.1 PaaI family thioesterase [Vibrio penaeicida]GLQ72210.1 thioesterase [Vibrio penaeicida]
MTTVLPTLQFLQQHIEGKLSSNVTTELRYPTAISTFLGFRIVDIDKGHAAIEVDAEPSIHGNQQGTVHGGFLSELADAAIGTAHSTAIDSGESFTSIDLQIKFFCPVWKSVLTAKACPVRLGKTISHYQCQIYRLDGQVVALASSTVMTLRGDSAVGR